MEKLVGQLAAQLILTLMDSEFESSSQIRNGHCYDMMAFPVSTLSHPSYETNERFLVQVTLAGPTAGGGWTVRTGNRICHVDRE